MVIEVKTEPKESENLNPSECLLAKIKKEIEEDFAINEALLFDEESSREEEEEEDNIVVKQEAGVDPLEEKQPPQLDHMNSCPVSKAESSQKSLKAEDSDTTKLLETGVSDGTESLVLPFDMDLAQQLSGILPVPTLTKDPVGSLSKEIKSKEEVKITRPSLKSFGGKNRSWWKPNVRRWWQRSKVEDLRGKIKGRWTALDSMPKRKEEVRTSFNREGGVLSRTFSRFGDNDKLKSVGWQREALVGKMIEERCTRKKVADGSCDRTPRKGDSEGKSVSQEGYTERSRKVNDVKEIIQKRSTIKRDEKVVVNVKAAERECRLQGFQQKGILDEKIKRTMRRNSSSSTRSTGSNASETKTATLDTSLGMLTQHPLLPNVFILDPKRQK